MKAPLTASKPERLEELASYDIVDTPREHSFCAHAILETEMLVTQTKGRAHPRVVGTRVLGLAGKLHVGRGLRDGARARAAHARRSIARLGHDFASLVEQTRRLEARLSSFADKQE